MARLFVCMLEIDVERCASCGDEPEIIAAILERPVTEKIPTHLG